MTTARDLKALVRQRMEKTGERYSAARRHVCHELHASSASKVAKSTDDSTPVRAGPIFEPVVICRFRTPEGAKAARPAINDRATLPVSQFVDITGILEFPENHRVLCQLETDSGICDQEFGEGYVMRGKDGREVFVGGVCARKQFHDHVRFAWESARARRDVTVADYVAKLQDLKSDPHLPQRLEAAEAHRHELYRQVDAVRECFTYAMLERIKALAKGTNSSISLQFEYPEKEEAPDGKIYLVPRWVPSVVARVAAPAALNLNRFNKVAAGVSRATQAHQVAEASTNHGVKTLQTWYASLEGLRDCELALDGIAKDLAAFKEASNLKGLVWLCNNYPERLSTTRSILRVLGQRTVTDEMARSVYSKWEAELRAAHRNRNFRVP